MSTALVHRFAPRGAAIEAWNYRGPEALLAGPAGTGKSRLALEKLHAMALKNPGMSGLIVRKTAVSLTASAVATYERDVAAEALLDGSVKFFGGSTREPAQYRYSNGSHIALGGMDNALKIMSTERDAVFAQEATELSQDDWEMITTRLRNGQVRFQQLIADCNPQGPDHWLKKRCEAGKTVMFHSRHEDNPRYFNPDGTMTDAGQDYMAKLDALTGVRYLRLRKGLWAAAEGVIFEEFNPALHVIDRRPIPPEWDRVWSVDFGFVHPFVWQDWAITPDGQAILVREIFHTQRLVEDHARDIRRICGLGPIDSLTGRAQPYAGPKVEGWDTRRPRIILCDHDAEDRATLERHLGWPTRPANKNVSDGLQTTQARFRPDGRGRARIMFMRDGVVRRDPALVDASKPTGTVEEIPGYVWNDKGKEEPRKIEDDGCDTMRYLVQEIDVSPRPRVRGIL